jgi:UDP-N-acetyl-D-glucosamine/UDP-N-acetyl-D-galactosamine dehydrogenase
LDLELAIIGLGRTAAAHDGFRAMGAGVIRALGKEAHILYDLKYILLADEADLRL